MAGILNSVFTMLEHTSPALLEVGYYRKILSVGMTLNSNFVKLLYEKSAC